MSRSDSSSKTTFNEIDTGMEIFQMCSPKCTDRNGHMKQDESEVCRRTLGLAVSTIPYSGAPGSAEFGSEAAFGIAACDSVPPEIQSALLQFRQ